MSEYPVQPVPDASDRLDPVAGSGTDDEPLLLVCPECGFHNGYHSESCAITEAELRAMWGDR